MARFLPISGPARHVKPQNPPQFTLEELETLVSTGTPRSVIDAVCDFKYGSCAMLINKDGDRRDLPVNESASILAQRIIRGDAVLVAEPEWDWLTILPLLTD